MGRGCAVVLAMLLAASLGARGEEVAQPVPAKGTCPVPADKMNWTSQEIFVWEHVCVGETADFNEGSRYGGDLDPKKPEGWPESRVLTSAFLETILLQDKYRRALTRRGVRIIGARFRETVDLENAELRHELWLHRSLLEQGANFGRLRSTHLISLTGSKVSGNLNMNGLHVDAPLFMRDGAEFAEVDLGHAHIGGQLDLSGSKVTGKGGAKVTGTLNMNGLQVDQSLFMGDGAEFAEVDLGSAHIGGQLDLSGSKVAGKGGAKVTGTLNMNGLRVDQSLLMGDKAAFAKVDLGGAHVGWQLELSGSKVTGKLDMDKLQVGASLFMRGGAEFAEVILNGAHVGSQLSLTGSKVSGKLDMDNLRVGGSLFMRGGAEFAAVNLNGAHVGSQLSLTDSNVSGDFDGEFIEVGGGVFLGEAAEFSGPIDLIFGKVEGSLELAGGIFHKDVDLTGMHIAGDLLLGSSEHKPAEWPKGYRPPGENSTLILRNARADAIQDLSDAWPDRLDLNGFAYRSLGGLNAAERDPMGERPVEWFREKWLGKQGHYSPQPYEQLATVLRAQGQPETADAILYAGRERERHQSPLGRWLWLSALKYFIGYGYGYRVFKALAWAALLLEIGAFVHWTRFVPRRRDIGPMILYSFEMLLPVIRLRGQTRDYIPHGWQDYYFHGHSVAGFILAAFLAAGLSGLTR